MLERLPVIVSQSHLPLQHLTDQPGDRGVLLGGFSACPQSRLIRDLDGQILRHEVSVARQKCSREDGTSLSECWAAVRTLEEGVWGRNLLKVSPQLVRPHPNPPHPLCTEDEAMTDRRYSDVQCHPDRRQIHQHPRERHHELPKLSLPAASGGFFRYPRQCTCLERREPLAKRGSKSSRCRPTSLWLGRRLPAREMAAQRRQPAQLDAALHEWLGIAIYRLPGWI